MKISLPKIAEGKSGTREFAIANTLFWAFLTVWQFFIRPPDQVETYYKMWDAVTTAVWLFNAGAFGITVAAKQGWFGGGPPPPRDTRDRPDVTRTPPP